MTRLFAALALAAVGCLEPLVDDTPTGGDHVLPPGTVLPTLAAADPAAADEVEAYDGVDDLVPLDTAFAAGGAIHTWDFGPAPTFAAPVFMLVRRTATGPERVAHNTLVDTVPGDAGYSPFWSMYLVYVTDRYQGEVIPSVAALDDALTKGLIEPPDPQEFAVNCPVVADDVALASGLGAATIPPNGHFNVKGRTVAYFDFGMMPLVDRVRLVETARYQLRREGGEPLSEPVRGVDITGDGDARDSNDVLAVDPSAALRSPLCRTIDVADQATTASIDTSGDETMADLRAADQLFDPEPVAGTVVAFHITDVLRNCPVQRQAGGL